VKIIMGTIDDIVKTIAGKEAGLVETGKTIIGGLAGMALPYLANTACVAFGAPPVLDPITVFNPKTALYTGGLAASAVGFFEYDSWYMSMLTLASGLYFGTRVASLASESLNLGYLGAGASSAIGTAASYGGALMSTVLGAATPFVGLGLLVMGVGYVGWKYGKGAYNLLTGAETHEKEKAPSPMGMPGMPRA
jgi:hypothetical protein